MNFLFNCMKPLINNPQGFLLTSICSLSLIGCIAQRDISEQTNPDGTNYCDSKGAGAASMTYIKGLYLGSPKYDQRDQWSSSGYFNMRKPFIVGHGPNRVTFIHGRKAEIQQPNLVHIWADFNQDEIFQDNEKIIDGTPVHRSDQFTISIPDHIPLGSKIRMRVLSVSSTQNPEFNSSCGNYTDGETRDFTLEVMDGVHVDKYCSDNDSRFVFFSAVEGLLAKTFKLLGGADTLSPESFGYNQPCAEAVGKIKYPVFPIDFSDHDPSIDFPFYKKYSQTDLEYVFNKAPFSVRKFFLNMSGGQLDINFDIRPWMSSSRQDGSLKSMQYYIDKPNGNKCRTEMLVNTLRDAVVLDGLNLDDYDRNNNGRVDGAYFLIEGVVSCWGATAYKPSWAQQTLNPMNPVLKDLDPIFLEASNSGSYTQLKRMLPEDDIWGYMMLDRGNPIYDYNSIPVAVSSEKNGRARGSDERNYNHNSTATIAHEIGHVLFGYFDLYRTGYNNHGPQSLGSSGHTMNGWEKVVFGGWIQPTVITQSGHYRITTDVIKDGTSYDKSKDYVLKIILDEKQSVYVSHRPWSRIKEEGRTLWFPRDENGPPAGPGVSFLEINGINIVSMYRHQEEGNIIPWAEKSNDRIPKTTTLTGINFSKGSVFKKCYDTSTGLRCLEIELLTDGNNLDAIVRVTFTD